MRDFPVGTTSKNLRDWLVKQGFTLNGPRSSDGNISWAWFRQSGGNSITATPAFGGVYWKEEAPSKLVWVTGDIGSTGL
jgi:hypothetical protein